MGEYIWGLTMVVVFGLLHHYAGWTSALLWIIIALGLTILKAAYGPAPKR